MEEDKETDSWFEFVEEYNTQSTVPLSYVLLPHTPQGYRTPGSPIGCLKLSKRKYNKYMRTRNEEKG